MELRETDRMLIDAVIRRAELRCPDALDVIAVYGSVQTGDLWEKSDLDLAIVINDKSGYVLVEGFLLEDTGIGYDLYCTPWEQLEEMPRYPNPQLSKLMDSQLVYCRNAEAEARFLALREACRERLDAPFSEVDFARVQYVLREAEHNFALAMTADTFSEARLHAYGTVQSSMDAVMLAAKSYYRRGVHRVFDELREAGAPDGFTERVRAVMAAKKLAELREALTGLLRIMLQFCEQAGAQFRPERKTPTPDDLRGTCEEMISNWAGKMQLAADCGDQWIAFASMSSFQSMLNRELGAAYRMPDFDVLSGFDAADLPASYRAFTASLETYREFCESIGLPLNRYPDAAAFVRAYAGDWSQ